MFSNSESYFTVNIQRLHPKRYQIIPIVLQYQTKIHYPKFKNICFSNCTNE